MASTSSSLASLLRKWSTCEISDAFVKLGHNRPWYIPDIVRYSPSRSASGGGPSKICGPAYTVKMALASDKASPKPEKHFVDAIGPEGCVVVISTPLGGRGRVSALSWTGSVIAKSNLVSQLFGVGS